MRENQSTNKHRESPRTDDLGSRGLLARFLALGTGDRSSSLFTLFVSQNALAALLNIHPIRNYSYSFSL